MNPITAGIRIFHRAPRVRRGDFDFATHYETERGTAGAVVAVGTAIALIALAAAWAHQLAALNAALKLALGLN